MYHLLLLFPSVTFGKLAVLTQAWGLFLVNEKLVLHSKPQLVHFFFLIEVKFSATRT